VEKENQKETNFQRITKKVIRFWLPVIIWAAIIFSFSARPVKPATQIFWKDFVIKKTAHMVEYAIFTILLSRALKASGVEKKEALIYSVILAILYGVSDEFHQSFTPGREPKLRDVVFDAMGSVLAVYGLWNLLPKAPKRLKTWAKKWQLI
jgi:VanZ family protein